MDSTKNATKLIEDNIIQSNDFSKMNHSNDSNIFIPSLDHYKDHIKNKQTIKVKEKKKLCFVSFSPLNNNLSNLF